MTVVLPEKKSTYPPTLDCRGFEDETGQWLAAAAWARTKLEQNHKQRIAIVVPNLDQSRNKIEHALHEILCPHKLFQASTSHHRPFHLSLGKNIAQYPMIQAALTLLSLTVHRVLPYDVLASVVISPFLRGEHSEAIQRSQMEMWMRTQLPFECTLSTLIETMKRADETIHCPILVDTLSGIDSMILTENPKRSFMFWGQFFKQCLEQSGWPGDTPTTSDEHQTAEAFFGHIKSIESIDLIGSVVTVSTAFGNLEKQLNEKPFQPEAEDVPVEVMGVLEAAGIQFDAIWFSGLSEKNWPPPLNPSPFIPRQPQQTSGLHQASIALNNELALSMQARLLADCDEIIYSRPLTENGLPLAPSPLIPFDVVATGTNESKLNLHEGALGERVQHRQDPTSLIQKMRHGFADTRQSIPPAGSDLLEWIDDDPGLPVTNPDMQGGTSLIQDQSLCPFRAYARHRLGARSHDPNEQGLDALDRGSIIHGALERLWTELRTLDRLKQMNDEERRSLVKQCAIDASRRYAFISGCGTRFLQTQTQWLCRLLDQWLETELKRKQDFSVVELEKTQTLTLAGLSLKFKIDRVDQLDDGSLVLLDYKTGSPTPLGQWMERRPEAPQLPLYAIAQTDPIEVIAFAHVINGQTGFRGISNETDFHHTASGELKVTPLEHHRSIKTTTSDWDTLIDHWRENLSALAVDFLQGKADVDPINALACSRCDLHGLCRVQELQQNSYQEAE